MGTAKARGTYEQRSIQTAWLSYMDDVVPKGAPTVQIQESKRAFVAGAKAVLSIVTEIGEDHVSEDQGLETLTALHSECDTFVKDVLAGKA